MNIESTRKNQVLFAHKGKGYALFQDDVDYSDTLPDTEVEIGPIGKKYYARGTMDGALPFTVNDYEDRTGDPVKIESDGSLFFSSTYSSNTTMYLYLMEGIGWNWGDLNCLTVDFTLTNGYSVNSFFIEDWNKTGASYSNSNGKVTVRVGGDTITSAETYSGNVRIVWKMENITWDGHSFLLTFDLKVSIIDTYNKSEEIIKTEAQHSLSNYFIGFYNYYSNTGAAIIHSIHAIGDNLENDCKGINLTPKHRYTLVEKQVPGNFKEVKNL